MSKARAFDEIARLPMPDDNVAIAIVNLSMGTRILRGEDEYTLSHTLLEGHRFSIATIESGGYLLSWGLPFGVATRDISPGEYVCNTGIIEALSLRHLDFDLPGSPNFEDRIVPFNVDETTFRPGEQVAPTETPRFFKGFRRVRRGVGTRNVILLLGTSSRTGGFVKLLEQRLNRVPERYPNIDGIVAIAHTEGGEADRPNNYEYVLRTLSGFCVHPNVGAMLAVDYGTESITNEDLSAYMDREGYAIDSLPHAFHRLDQGLTESLDQTSVIVESWLDEVNATARTQEPVAELKIALQCGGSDAFSGVSGNPLASWVAREVIRNGGAANLAETDELIGAEAYVLQNVRDIETARQFVRKVEAYKELAAWHGTTAEGNPSGGNKYRGLYNIVLKSIGAAMKRHPDVRLDAVIDYGQPMIDPGYYFMDSPGNDLESIAGQIASGCNLVFFVTGNGSITNFPFVPTLKIITTTGRYELLSDEMDVNAGAYLDGQSMDEVGSTFFDQTLRVASGELSKGEVADHSQISLWRNWRQTDVRNLQSIEAIPSPTDEPLVIAAPAPALTHRYDARTGADGEPASDAIGLLLPTSLCSGQIAQKCADTLNQKQIGIPTSLSRYAALVHTEGCGVAGEENERIFTRAMLNYLIHPSVRYAFIMEHGCEKTHNDFIQHHLESNGLHLEQFGWASIQMDGGIDNVLQMAEAWFTARIGQEESSTTTSEPLSRLRIGIASEGTVTERSGGCVGELTNRLISDGGTVIIPAGDGLWASDAYLQSTVGSYDGRSTLAHGGRPKVAGLHAMENPTSHWVETLTGLAAAGTDIILALPGDHSLQGHPLVPVLQIADDRVTAVYRADVDLALDACVGVEQLAQLIADAASGRCTTKMGMLGNTDFQFTRGLLGVSM